MRSRYTQSLVLDYITNRKLTLLGISGTLQHSQNTLDLADAAREQSGRTERGTAPNARVLNDLRVILTRKNDT